MNPTNYINDILEKYHYTNDSKCIILQLLTIQTFFKWVLSVNSIKNLLITLLIQLKDQQDKSVTQ